jgi:hypothetical protein
MKQVPLAVGFTFVFHLVSGCDLGSPLRIAPTDDDVRFAVISSNYSGAASVALLEEDGDVIDDTWVGSYTSNPKLRSPLANDVVLPTQSAYPRILTTIERGIGVVSRFDIRTGSVLGQLRTDQSPEDEQAAYHSNPQDVVYLNEKSAWISRWEPNLNPDPDPQESGNDLIEINPTKMTRTKRRIDLSPYNESIIVPTFDEDQNPTGEKEVTAYARPSGMISVNRFAVVGLSRLTASFEPGSGMAVIADLAGARITDAVALEGLRNCGEVKPVAGDADRALITCAGKWDKRREGAGIALLEVDPDGFASVRHIWRSTDHPEAANTQSMVVSLGGTTVVAVDPGERNADTKEIIKTDTLYLLDLENGEQKKILTSKGVYSIGNGAYDPDTSILLIPDAGKDDSPEFYGLRRFKIDKDLNPTKKGIVEIAPDLMLPARNVYRL